MNTMRDTARVRVKAITRILGYGVPDDAQPGDLVVGNRGAAALVRLEQRLNVLYLDYVGNVDFGVRAAPGLQNVQFPIVPHGSY